MNSRLSRAVREALTAVGRELDLGVQPVRVIRAHDATTLLLPRAGLVVRLVPDTGTALARAASAVRVAAWLTEVDFPAVRAYVDKPVVAAGFVATVWHRVPPQPRSDIRIMHTALGRLLRDLHALPPIPVELPVVDPLSQLDEALERDAARTEPVLRGGGLEFLRQEVIALRRRYQALTFPLGTGLIHNDAHPGNMVADPSTRYGYRLLDWEGACLGPRELDLVLVGGPGSRFGDTEEQRRAFVDGYGYDIAAWPEHSTLHYIRDLHSLAAYIRAAPHRRAARIELRRRLSSLLSGNLAIRWYAV